MAPRCQASSFVIAGVRCQPSMHIPTNTPRVHGLTTPTHARRRAGHPLAGGRLGKPNAVRTILGRFVSSSRKNRSILEDAVRQAYSPDSFSVMCTITTAFLTRNDSRVSEMRTRQYAARAISICTASCDLASVSVSDFAAKRIHLGSCNCMCRCVHSPRGDSPKWSLHLCRIRRQWLHSVRPRKVRAGLRLCTKVAYKYRASPQG